MKRGVKIFIGVAGALFLFGVIAVIGGILALNYIESRIDESTKQYEAEGLEFGKTADQQGCINEGLRRAKSATVFEVGDGLANLVFVEACLKQCSPTKDFCSGVPSFWSTQDSEWKIEECRKAGLDEQKTGCMHVFKAKHNFCNSR